MAKRVQHPRGTTAQENNVVGEDGQLRVDSSRQELRLHDGQTPGGRRIPNIETVKQLIASGAEGAAGVIRLFNTIEELQALNPNSNTIAFVKEDGNEELYFWKAGAGDAGTIPSAIDGHWHRADSLVGTVIRLWRAGLVFMQIDGLEPTVNPGQMLWLNAGELMAHDGTDYEPITPILFARYMAQVGGYSTSTFVVPDRIQAEAVEIADVNTANESGWYKTKPDAANSPIAGIHNIEVRMLSTTRGSQRILVSDGGGTYYLRFRDGPAWASDWTLVDPFSLPSRLASAQTLLDDMDDALESGFYAFDSDTVDRPAWIDAGYVLVLAVGTDDLIQYVFPFDGAEFTHRVRVGGTFTPYKEASADDVSEVSFFARATAPYRYLKANGALLSRTTYAALFAAIGITFGAGDGATTFRLPDLRGEFIRGWDDGRGIDAGRVFGSWQDSENKSHIHTGVAAAGGGHTHTGTAASAGAHTHPIAVQGGAGSTEGINAPGGGGLNPAATRPTLSSGAHTHTLTINSVADHTHTVTIDSSGGAESRPRNVALLACIKY